MLWGHKAGTLIATKSGYNTGICFFFEPSFLTTGLDIAPLRAPLNGVAAQNRMPQCH